MRRLYKLEKKRYSNRIDEHDRITGVPHIPIDAIPDAPGSAPGYETVLHTLSDLVINSITWKPKKIIREAFFSYRYI